MMEENNFLKKKYRSLELLEEEFLRDIYEKRFQAIFAQLEYLRSICTIYIGISSIGYFYAERLDKSYLICTFIISIISIIFIHSYHREIIDKVGNQESVKKFLEQNKILKDEILKEIENPTYKSTVKIINLEKEDFNYIIEIINFLLYFALFSIIISYFAYKYNFNFFSYITVLMFFVCYTISFNNWTINFSQFISEVIENIKRKNY